MEQKKASDAIIVIPAYNEAKYIGKVLEPCLKAKKEGIVKEVIVVNDGSTDNTAKIARAAGTKVISCEQNKGKGTVFFLGLKKCREQGADTMIMLDADLLNLKIEHIEELLANVSVKGKKMAVINVYEGEMFTGGRFSGQRAIKVNAMKFLFMKGKGGGLTNPAKRFMKMAYRFGLETALSNIIHERDTAYFCPKKKLKARAMHYKSGKMQSVQIKAACNLISKRTKELKRALVKRRNRK